jgi:hypothetical protein
MNIFFSRKRRRAALHYIKKRIKGKSPNITTQHTPLTVSRNTFAPVTEPHTGDHYELNTLTTREEGSQEGQPSSPCHRPSAAFLAG